MRCTLGLACGLLVTLAAPSARAEEPPLSVDLSLYALASAGALQRRPLHDAPAYKAADLRLSGFGVFTGGAFNYAITYDHRIRGGMGFDFFDVGGTSLTHGPIGKDLTFTYHRPWGSDVEVFAGRSFDLGRFRPYLDLRLGATFVKTSIDVRSARVGEVATLTSALVTPLLAPRLGAQVRLTDRWALEVAGSFSPIGAAQASLFAGISFSPLLESDTKANAKAK